MTISTGNVLAMFAFAVWGLWGSRILYWLTSDDSDWFGWDEEIPVFFALSLFFVIVLALSA